MAIRSALNSAQDDIADNPTGAKAAIDFGAVHDTINAGVKRTQEIEDAKAVAQEQEVARAKAPPVKAKIFYNPRTQHYFVGGREVVARFDTLKYLSEAADLPDSTDAPTGYVPLAQGTLKNYVAQIHSEMEGTPLVHLWDSLKSSTGAAVAGIPRLLGYDWQNNFADSHEESYKEMSLREQAGADEGAFDSWTGFTNSASSGVGSAIPAIGAGVITSALTLNPGAGLAAAGAVGFSSAAGDDSEQSQIAIAQTFAAMPEDERREASEAYATLRDHGVPEDLAIDQVSMEAARVSGFVGGMTTIPETLIGGKMVGNFLRKIPGLDKLVGAGKQRVIEGALGKVAQRLEQIPAPLRFLGRTGAAATGEGAQEVAEASLSQAAGNAVAGVGSTNPLDHVRQEDFEGGFTAGLVFGAAGGGRSGHRGSDIEMAMGHVEATDTPTPPPAPPEVPAMPQLPDQPLARQLELVQNVLAERYGANWMDNVDFLAQDPGARQLIGQFSGIQQEMQRAAMADPAAPVDPFTGAQGDALPYRPQYDGAPAPGAQGELFGGRSLGGPEAGLPSTMGEEPVVDPAQDTLPLQNALPAQPDEQAGMAPPTAEQMQAVQALAGITGATSMEELQGQLPQLMQMAEEFPQLQQILIDAGMVPRPMPGPVAAPAPEPGPAVGPAGQALLDRVQAPPPPEAPSQAAPGGDRPMGVAPAPLVNEEPMSPGEAASRQQAQLERGGEPIVDPAAAQGAPQPFEPVPSTPEPVEDIAAQIDALVSPQSERRAVFVAEGNEDALPDMLPPKVKAYSRPGVGVLLTTKPALGKRFMDKADLNDADIAGLLGIPQDKASVAAAGEAPVVVQAVNPDGAVAAESVTSPGEVLRAKIAAKKQATPKAEVQVTTPEAAQERRAVKLGPKGEAVREASKKREAERATKVEAVKKKSEDVAPVNRLDAIASAAKKAKRQYIDEETVPVKGTITRDGEREIPAPKSVFVETGSRDGPVDLRVQLIDEATRGRLRGLLKKANPEDAKTINKILAAFDRAEATLQADVAKAEKALTDEYMADPHLKAQYEVEIAQMHAPSSTEEGGRPKASPLYALPLLDSEMADFVHQMVAQAKYELQRKTGHEKSLAIRMLSAIIPQAPKVEALSHAEQILSSIANLNAEAQATLIRHAAPSLRKSTLAKQVTRGATEVAYVAARGENVDDNMSRAKAFDQLTKRNYAYVTGYGSIPQEAAKVVNGWAQLFERVTSIKAATDLRVMTIDDAIRLLPDRPDIRRGMTGAYIPATIDGKAVHIFAVDWNSVPEPIAIEALAHEFGHFVSAHVYEKSDMRTREAVRFAYKRWLEANSGKSAADVMRSRLAPASADYLEEGMDRNMQYAASFSEWSADNAARWLLTQREPKSLVDKYFARIAKVMREIYEKVVGKGKPDTVWQDVLDAWTAGARAKAAISEQLSDGRWDEIDAGEEVEVSPRERLQMRQARVHAVDAMEALRPLGDAFDAILTPGKQNAIKQQIKGSATWDTLRKYGLQLLTTHQIADRYKDTPIGKSLGALVTIRDRIDARARKLQAKGADALAKAQNLSAASQSLLQRVMKDATYYNINPEVEIQHPSNDHVLKGLTGDAAAEQARRFDKARLTYLEMVRVDPRTADIYIELREAFEEIRTATINTKIENLKKSGMSTDAINALEERLKALLAQKREGPYFPLMRDGDWIVTATLPAEAFGEGGRINDGAKEFTTKSAAQKEARNLKARFPGARVSVEADDGHYTVRVYQRGVYFFDSENAARAATPQIEEEIRSHYKINNADYDATVEALKGIDDDEGPGIVSQPYKKLSTYEASKRPPSDQFITDLRQLLNEGKVSQQVVSAVEEMYLESLPEFSYRKSQLRRDNVLGASDKMLYSYAHRYAGAAHNLATIEDSDVLNKAWKDLKEARHNFAPAADVVNTIELNDQLVTERASGTPGNRALNLISDLNSMYSLALSPAYVLMNSAQPAMITVPFLAGITKPNGESVGITTAAKYVKDAYAGAASYFSKRGMQDFVSEMQRLIGSKSEDVGTADHAKDMIKKFAKGEHEEALLNEMIDRGLLDFSFLNSLQDAMRMGKAGQKLGVLMRIGMAFPQQVEAMNRVVTALAAYRMATKELGMEAGSGDPIEFVASTVRKTQLDYSRKNRPALFNRPLAGMVLQFRLYTQGMYMLFVENGIKALRGETPEIRKEGYKTIAYLMATHAAIGGVAGIAPMVYLPKLALGAALKAGMDDDDKDKWKSTDDLLRSYATDVLGEKGGRAVMNGLPTLLNMDLSSKLGLPSIYDSKYTGTTESTKPSDAFDNAFLYFMGSPYANARRVYVGMGDLAEGHVADASKALPAGMRAAARALVFSDKGILDSDGDVFVPRDALGWGDLAIKAAGIETADVADAYRERSQKYDTKARIGGRRQDLMADYRNAEDAAGRRAVRDEIREYNKSVPQAFRISYAQLQEAVESKRERESGKLNKQDQAIEEIIQ